MSFKKIWDMLKETIDEYSNDKVPKLAAALSYYTVFSVAPLLVIAIAVAGFVFGEAATQGKVAQELRGLLGDQGAQFVQTAIQNTNRSGGGVLATILGVVTLLIGATGTFVELQDSLDIIWKVRPKPGTTLKQFIRTRLTSFGLILAVGFLLLVSLLISAMLSALQDFLGSVLPIPPFILQILNIVFSLGVSFVLFALLFKVLPDVQVSWRDVWIGALATTILFVVGMYLIGLYLGRGSVSSSYGAAGSLAVFLVWVYYSAQILYLGAVFTYIYTIRFGSGVKPSAHAEPLVLPLQQHAKTGS